MCPAPVRTTGPSGPSVTGQASEFSCGKAESLTCQQLPTLGYRGARRGGRTKAFVCPAAEEDEKQQLLPDPVEAPTAAGSGLEPKETSQSSQVGDPEPRVGKSCWGNCPPIPIHSSIHHLCIYLSACLSITYQCIHLLSISHPSIHPSVIHPSICPSFPQAHIEHYGGPGPGLGTGKTAVNKVPTHKGLIF